MKNLLFISILFLHSCFCQSQNRNAIWCFGDSAGIDFKNGVIPITSLVAGRGSCVSICDSYGSMLFYAATMIYSNNYFPKSTMVFDETNSLMLNGDSIKGTNWYKELVIVPMPGDSMKYYLFSIGVTSGPGFSYSIIDMSQNGGLGAVIQKNVLLESFKAVDCMEAVKHGNGRDWWIAIRDAATSNNEHRIYLVSPSGISLPIVQNVGSVNSLNTGRYSFSPDGSKIAFINYWGLFELYDFDRCTGLVSNPLTIHPEPTALPIRSFWSCEFSPNGRFLYVTASSDTSYLYQYDLQSPNPASTRLTLATNTDQTHAMGQIRRGPDDKIYLSTWYLCPVSPYCYPYPDSVYNTINSNLGVINFPDSLGIACGYLPFSFNLGGKRTYIGLPNNPDYDLPALAGSPCDTLVSQNELAGAASVGSLHVYYHSDWDKAFINASNLKGKTGKLLVYDIQGKVVHSEPLRIQNGYYTRDLSMMGRADGMYMVVVETEKERLVKKVLID